MTALLDARDSGWLPSALEGLATEGYAIVTGVLAAELVADTRAAMYRAQARIVEEVGSERLKRAGEVGVLRLMFKYEPVFFRYLEIPEQLEIVDAVLGSTAILHLQNGFILPSQAELTPGTVFQNTFHRDFPRYLNGYQASLNAMFAIDEFTAQNGATRVVPRSHQQDAPPTDEAMRESVAVVCPAGSMFVFDSTLWHAAGSNQSGADRLAINHQFTRSYIKQQIDYVRALGGDVVTAQPARTQQLLGWYTRVVTCLDEYYRPEAERLYRRGQG